MIRQIAIATPVVAAVLLVSALARDRLPVPKVEGSVSDTKGSSLRAFYTAPPVIPHDIKVRRNHDCLTCHADVLKLGERVSVATPHSELSNCQQCHVGVQGFNSAFEIAFTDSSWVGLEAPRTSEPLNAFLPPTIPHHHFMRENCLSCHAADNPDESMRTPHPKRTQCLQCHAFESERGILVRDW